MFSGKMLKLFTDCVVEGRFQKWLLPLLGFDKVYGCFTWVVCYSPQQVVYGDK